MPELPEVETTRQGLAPVLVDRVASGCVVRNSRMRLPVPADLGERVRGQRLRDIARRAKYLLFDFGTGHVIVHLGMSGSLRLVPAQEPPKLHDHVDIVFDEWVLRMRDPRRFGLVIWHEGAPEAHPLLAGLGREPLAEGFDGAWLYAMTRGLRAPIKQVLMDGRRLVGVGNIYASESLFRAGINPHTAAGRIGLQRYERLAAAVRETLLAAIAAGGSTLRDFVGGDGRAGYFQQHYGVYGRGEEPCRVCGQPVRRALIGQRATYWCPRCQQR